MSTNFWKSIIDPKYATSHGSASWATIRERRKVLKKSNDGVYIANDLRLDRLSSFKNLALISPVGAGKTSKYILNNALRDWKNNRTSLIFYDPAGETHANSANWLSQKQRFRVLKLDLTNLDGEKYNPLATVHHKSSARMVAKSLIGAVYDNSKGDVFWTESAISLLSLLILATVTGIPQQDRNLATVNRLINKFGHAQEEVDSLMELALNDEDFESYVGYLNNTDKVRQSVEATIKSALYVYADDVLKTLCNQSTFALSDLREQRIALFLIQEEHKIPYYKGFWSLFFRQLFECLLTQSDGNDVFMFCDEFSAYSPIPDMETIMAVIRKKRCHVSIVLQSYEQLVTNYGQDKAKIIYDNCVSRLYYSGLSHESAKMVSESLGEKTHTYSETLMFKPNMPMERTSRNLMNPDEVRTIKPNQGIFTHGGYKPIFLRNIKTFFQNNLLKKRSRL